MEMFENISRWFLARYPRPVVIGGIVLLGVLAFAFVARYIEVVFWVAIGLGVVAIFPLSWWLIDEWLPKREKKE